MRRPKILNVLLEYHAGPFRQACRVELHRVILTSNIPFVEGHCSLQRGRKGLHMDIHDPQIHKSFLRSPLAKLPVRHII